MDRTPTQWRTHPPRTNNTRPVTIIEDLPETDTEARVTYTQQYLVDSAALAEGKPLCSAHGTLSPLMVKHAKAAK